MRALIVDDELYARKALALKLQKYCPEVEVLDLIDSAATAITAIHVNSPDLLFLDIEMPGEGGFAMLETLGAFDCNIVFVTAFEQYALRAIKHSALDYLLKPVNPQDLQAAVAKAQRLLEPRPAKKREHEYLPIRKLVLPTEQGFEFVRIMDIIRCRAEGNYTRLLLKNAEDLVVSRNLGEIESLIANDNFYRIHMSHLINLVFVKKYLRGRGGEVEMIDGSRVQVSSRRRDAFLSFIVGP